MQSYALTVDKFLDHAAKWWGDREIVTAEAGRIGYAALQSAQQPPVGRADGAGPALSAIASPRLRGTRSIIWRCITRAWARASSATRSIRA